MAQAVFDGNRAHIDGEEIASGGQNIGTPSGRRARWAGRHEAPRKSGKQMSCFLSSTGIDCRSQIGTDPVKHSPCCLHAGGAIYFPGDQCLGQQLNPLDGIATMTPEGSRLFGKQVWPRAIPCLRKEAIQRVKRLSCHSQTEILTDGPVQ